MALFTQVAVALLVVLFSCCSLHTIALSPVLQLRQNAAISDSSVFSRHSDHFLLTKVQKSRKVKQDLAYPRSGQVSSTALGMYNLPPGKNDSSGLGDILKGAATLIFIVAFFASPLGGLVLGIFNSFLLLALLLPVAGTVAFSVWQYFNTIQGTCPNCGAPVRVLKAKDDGSVVDPSICFTCGSILQARYDNSGIDNITGRTTIDDMQGAAGNGIFDILSGPPSSWDTVKGQRTTIVQDRSSEDTKKKKIRRESTIIDVEVSDDEPWQ